MVYYGLKRTDILGLLFLLSQRKYNCQIQKCIIFLLEILEIS